MAEDEADAVLDLNANLHGVAFNVEAWSAALELYKFSRSRPDNVDRNLARKWRFIAADQCVMQLYYLRERLKVIKPQDQGCKTIADVIDFRYSKLIKESRRLLPRP
jgi:hypothetical protein